MTVFLEDVEKDKIVQGKVRLLFPVKFKLKETTGKKHPQIRKHRKEEKRQVEQGKQSRLLTKKRISEIIRSHKKAHHGDGHYYLLYEK